MTGTGAFHWLMLLPGSLITQLRGEHAWKAPVVLGTVISW